MSSPITDVLDLADASPTAGLPQAVKVLGSVVAPTTLLTALLYYFGLNHSNHFLLYFGVNPTVMGLTTADYFVRSADGLYHPLVYAAAAGLTVLWGYRAVQGRLGTGSLVRLLRLLTPVAALVGLVSVGFAIAAAIDPVQFRLLLALPGVLLAIGVLLLATASRLQRVLWNGVGPSRRRPPVPATVTIIEAAAVFVLVGVGLFWSVTDYSAAVGRGRAVMMQNMLPAWPDAVVYSDRDLGLAGPGLREVECQAADDAYRYRYEGLKLVLQSGDQFLLLPAQWTRREGAAVVLPRTDSIRLEFAGPGTTLGDTC